MRLRVDSAWALTRERVLIAVRGAARGMIVAEGVDSPLHEMLTLPCGSMTMRSVAAFCAPAKGSGLLARYQWVRALLALEPCLRHHAPSLVHIVRPAVPSQRVLRNVMSFAYPPDVRRGDAPRSTAAAWCFGLLALERTLRHARTALPPRTTARLSLVEVVAKDWIESHSALALATPLRGLARGANEVHPWLATMLLCGGGAALNVQGVDGASGVYEFNAMHSPTNGASVYSKFSRASLSGSMKSGGLHIFRADDGRWRLNSYDRMVFGAGAHINTPPQALGLSPPPNHSFTAPSAIASSTVAALPVGLAWGRGCAISPCITIEALSGTLLATHTAAKAVALSVTEVELSGHDGVQNALMGVYAIDRCRGMLGGANIYTHRDTQAHLHRSWAGKWYISSTKDMNDSGSKIPVANQPRSVHGGKRLGESYAPAAWIRSAVASFTPLGLAWDFARANYFHHDCNLRSHAPDGASAPRARAHFDTVQL